MVKEVPSIVHVYIFVQCLYRISIQAAYDTIDVFVFFVVGQKRAEQWRARLPRQRAFIHGKV